MFKYILKHYIKLHKNLTLNSNVRVADGIKRVYGEYYGPYFVVFHKQSIKLYFLLF